MKRVEIERANIYVAIINVLSFGFLACLFWINIPLWVFLFWVMLIAVCATYGLRFAIEQKNTLWTVLMVICQLVLVGYFSNYAITQSL